MHELRQAHPAWNRSHKIPLPQLRRNPNETLRKMPQVRARLQMPQMRLHRTIKADEQMGSVIVTYKVFPEDIMKSFDGMKKQIEKVLPEFATLEGYGEEPVAFGLVALLVQVRFPEDKTGIVDEFETALGKIEHVSQAQTLMVRRSSR
jgi:translation elongation factor aEF-1 beta